MPNSNVKSYSTTEMFQGNLTAKHKITTPDGVYHSHNYIEIELIDRGDGISVVNDNDIELKRGNLTVMRPVIDNHSLAVHSSYTFDLSMEFIPNTQYEIESGIIQIVSGEHKGLYYVFMIVNGNLVAETLTDLSEFKCSAIGFYAVNYHTENIHIIGTSDLSSTDYCALSKVLAKSDVLDFYDVINNNDLNMNSDFLCPKEEFEPFEFSPQKANTSHSVVYKFKTVVEKIGNRIFILRFYNQDKSNCIGVSIAAKNIKITNFLGGKAFSIYSAYISPDYIPENIYKKFLNCNKSLNITLSEDETLRFIELFKLLITAVESTEKYSEQIAKNLMDAMLLDILNHLPDDEIQNDIRGKIISFFSNTENLSSGMTLEDFAKYLGYNTAYASQFCIKEMGSSFSDLKNIYRNSYAKHLLAYSDYSVSRISEECGFHSLSVFNRAFKASTGLSPLQYRKKNKPHLHSVSPNET